MNRKNKIGLTIPYADERLKKRCFDKAVSIYGTPVLPKEVSKRLELELDAIISNGYASDYLFAAILADRASELGYTVTTRGMLSSSFVAYLCGISKVNPLPVHYHCTCCHYFETVDLDTYYAACGFDHNNELGYDLLNEVCPICGDEMKADGNDIKPEILMGIDYCNEPSIILNFPSCIRKEIARYMKEQFPEYNFFIAGTSVVRSDGSIFKGKHPGGVFIVPKDIDITDYTPLREYDAEDDFEIPITDVDCHELRNYFKKYDILTLNELDFLHYLEEETGIKTDDIDLNDKGIMSVFQEEGFHFIPEWSKFPTTSHVDKQIISLFKPERFSDIVHMLGLLSGTNTWKNNGEELIWMGVDPRRLISSRDDLYQELQDMGIERNKSWKIMSDVRGYKGVSNTNERIMLEAGIPQWYIDSCRRIKYLFPKSHAIEYAIIYVKIAFYRKYYPSLFDELKKRL